MLEPLFLNVRLFLPPAPSPRPPLSPPPPAPRLSNATPGRPGTGTRPGAPPSWSAREAPPAPREPAPGPSGSTEPYTHRPRDTPPPPYQDDCIRAILGEPLVAIVKGRQIGATQYVIAPAVVYFAFTRPYTTVLITSLTM